MSKYCSIILGNQKVSNIINLSGFLCGMEFGGFKQDCNESKKHWIVKVDFRDKLLFNIWQ